MVRGGWKTCRIASSKRLSDSLLLSRLSRRLQRLRVIKAARSQQPPRQATPCHPENVNRPLKPAVSIRRPQPLCPVRGITENGFQAKRRQGCACPVMRLTENRRCRVVYLPPFNPPRGNSSAGQRQVPSHQPATHRRRQAAHLFILCRPSPAVKAHTAHPPPKKPKQRLKQKLTVTQSDIKTAPVHPKGASGDFF